MNKPSKEGLQALMITSRLNQTIYMVVAMIFFCSIIIIMIPVRIVLNLNSNILLFLTGIILSIPTAYCIIKSLQSRDEWVEVSEELYYYDDVEPAKNNEEHTDLNSLKRKEPFKF